MEYCRISLSDAWDMPVFMRKWWLERKTTENKRIEDERKKAEQRGRRKG